MFSKLQRFTAIAVLTTLTSILIHQPTQAQSKDPDLLQPTTLSIDVIRPGSPLNLSELMNQAYWQNSGSFFRQSTSLAHLEFILGWGGFPEGSYSENSIARDSLLMNIIVRDYFKQLQQREPNVRTRDLPNPFDTSIRQYPCYLPDSQDPCGFR